MPKKKTPIELKFIEFVRQQCHENDVKCVLNNVKYLKLGKIRCSGYFDGDCRILAVSMNRPDWIEILAHEYCHMTQWLDKIPIWAKAETGVLKIDEWLVGKEIKNINKFIDAARDLELDNEKRTVALIKKMKLPVDIDYYIKKSNSYIHFYNWLKITRKWSKPENAPYVNKNVIAAMSNKFNMSYKSLNKKLYALYETENI